MNTTQQDTRNWKIWPSAVPLTAVQVLVVDLQGRVLMLHRSDKVRSAKNVWSFPSGLHDIGETLEECAKRELIEEFGLDIKQVSMIGLYENIDGDKSTEDRFHWVLAVQTAFVPDLDVFVNHEPDKHDLVALVDIKDFATPDFFRVYNFHQSFVSWATRHSSDLQSKLRGVQFRGVQAQKHAEQSNA